METEIAPPPAQEMDSIVTQAEIEFAITTGQARFAGVGDGRKVRINDKGALTFVGDMTWEQFGNLMKMWKWVGEYYHFWLADTISKGREKFGEVETAKLIEQLQFDLSDAVKGFAISQITPELRELGLTSEHYYILGRMLPSDAHGQKKWADLAHEEKLNAFELKKSIDAGKVTRQEVVNEESGRDSGIPNVQGLSVWFARWEKQVGGKEKVLEWPAELRRKWLDEVHELVDLADAVKKSLEGVAPAAPESSGAAS